MQILGKFGAKTKLTFSTLAPSPCLKNVPPTLLYAGFAALHKATKIERQ